MDPALRQRTYSDLTSEILSTEDCDEGQAAEPTGASLDTSPPQKKSAMAELFGETFVSLEMDSKNPSVIIKEEVASYMAASEQHIGNTRDASRAVLAPWQHYTDARREHLNTGNTAAGPRRTGDTERAVRDGSHMDSGSHESAT
uniref:Uncharacterized protein n=1 Tax=Knipowitschia caucasica TaxID=637954 RepID=A0AAV2M8E4_KNICA